MMTLIRRSTQFALITVVVAIGVLLALEVTDVTGSAWRNDLADATRSVLAPDIEKWGLALLGATMGIGSIILIAAQLAPAPRGNSRMFEVGKNDDGTTRLTGRAALRAVEHELRQIEGVTSATAVMPKAKRIDATVRVDDRCDLAAIETQARMVLDTPFWIDLGLPDIGVTITAEFDPRPPRVR